jgi:hypothetical protein
MTSAWNGAPEPEGPEFNFVSLKNEGDEFVGQVKSVELITIPKGTLPQQPTDLHDIPRVMYTGVDGQEYEFKYTTAVFRNGILRLRPEPGTWVYHRRGGKNPKGYIDGVVREARPEETTPGARTTYSAPAESVGAREVAPAQAKTFNAEPTGPATDDAPPF